MKWYHYFGMGAAFSAALFTVASVIYDTFPRKSKQISIELEQKIDEAERLLLKDLDDLLKSIDEDTPASKPKEVSEKEKEITEYLIKNLDFTEISKREDYMLEYLVENDGLNFLKYLHEELGLKTIEWNKIKIDSETFGVSSLYNIAKTCKDKNQKEKMLDPALIDFLNYWRKFPGVAERDFSFEQMLRFSNMPIKGKNFQTVDDIFDCLGYESRHITDEDILDLLDIDQETVNQAQQKNCPINDLYMLNLAETDPQAKKAYQNPKDLQAELEGRLSNLEHLFRTYKDENNKPDTNYIETPDLSQIDSFNQLRIKLLLDALQEKETLAQIKELALKDLNDNKTEHGGVVVMSNNGLSFTDYPSKINFDPFFNGMYQPSYNQYKFNGVCNYHFHAIKEEDTSKFAGPSAGDLSVQRKYKSTGLVITYLDNDKINADFFYKTPEFKELVVDLGIYDLKK